MLDSLSDRSKHIALGAAVGVFFTLSTTAIVFATREKIARLISLPKADQGSLICDGVAGLIGNTPMMRIKSLSEATGCEILAKAEFLNPGGSTKDRVALSMINTAEREHILTPGNGSTIFEGTVGSTGISLAMMAKARGYNAWVVMPDDVAQEKSQLLEKLGAHVEKVRPVSIVDKNQFVNLAKRRAQEFGKNDDGAEGSASQKTGFFADQFENLANFEAHFTTTGPEIYRQTQGTVDAIVMGAGTGGTLAGVAKYLKALLPDLRTYLADPQGSGLFNKVKYNIMYSPTEKEGKRKRHQVDTVVEGVGINRLTRNFALSEGFIDDAIRVTDQEAIDMARYLVHKEGLFIGSSSAVNCVAAVRIARELGPGHTIVTLLCDSGQRHLTKFWNDEYLVKQGLTVNDVVEDLDFIV
ncbi:tryptophan synthase beta subunit-like PLP-dependent enzyme [Gamsiella multidivaricata]|uniref:tryptophan synthase beta subunit-like PLP-dependent enzyme n=1 Tax=Gamsiella multidivaricata TaxID=101098 RepID=UPI002220B9A5|nr:tryptophan synthase beta subunit-like PLP-dependent enzyme [Gamsiella multidivaricata]KAI7816569.1 tryptophan synthase beta subunit-like PLP-dependent enzyme [Gamsiella multidivaricata]